MGIVVARLARQREPFVLRCAAGLRSMACLTPNIQVLSFKRELRRCMVEDDCFPHLRRVTRLASALFHDLAKFPFMRIAVTRFARERGKPERRLLRLLRGVARYARNRAVRRRQREDGRMLSDRKRRWRESLYRMALCAIVFVRPGELTLMIIGVAIGAELVG